MSKPAARERAPKRKPAVDPGARGAAKKSAKNAASVGAEPQRAKSTTAAKAAQSTRSTTSAKAAPMTKSTTGAKGAQSTRSTTGAKGAQATTVAKGTKSTTVAKAAQGTKSTTVAKAAQGTRSTTVAKAAQGTRSTTVAKAAQGTRSTTVAKAAQGTKSTTVAKAARARSEREAAEERATKRFGSLAPAGRSELPRHRATSRPPARAARRNTEPYLPDEPDSPREHGTPRERPAPRRRTTRPPVQPRDTRTHVHRAALEALLSALVEEPARRVSAEEAALVLRAFLPFRDPHDDVVEAVAAAADAMRRSSRANLLFLMQLDGWVAAVLARQNPRANEPILAAQLRELGTRSVERSDHGVVLAAAEALERLSEIADVGGHVVACPAFAEHLALVEADLVYLPNRARHACCEALVAHGEPGAAILGRLRARLEDIARERPQRVDALRPFIDQLDEWITRALVGPAADQAGDAPR